MRPDPNDSPFSARMQEIDDDAPAPGLATVCLSWGCLLAVLIALGAGASVVLPYYLAASGSPRRERTETALRTMEDDSADNARGRALLGGGGGLLLGLGILAAWGREDIAAALKQRKRK